MTALGFALSQLRRIKNTTRIGQSLIQPSYDTLKRLSQHTIKDDHGILRSVARLTENRKLALAARYAYQARAQIALDVASTYPGGDYFEFGSAGLFTFRNFLAAFDINSAHTKHFPNTRFYAFDIFGNPDQGSGPSPDERAFFEHWRAPPHSRDTRLLLSPYGSLKDRCVLVSGYYHDTLNEELKAKLRAGNRKIGFAFLDCNLLSSYKLVFDFLLDVIGSYKMYIYLDEYFCDHPVANLYDGVFVKELKERHKLRSIYMRNAGSFGALFCLMPAYA